MRREASITKSTTDQGWMVCNYNSLDMYFMVIYTIDDLVRSPTRFKQRLLSIGHCCSVNYFKTYVQK